MTKIKICGLSRPEDIDYVNEARPDYCGFVIGVPSSRRNISVETLYRLRSRLSDQVTAVGVFVNTEAELPARLLKDGVISLAQLHGQEDEAYIRKVRELSGISGGRIIKAFPVRRRKDVERAFKSSADMLLLDHGKGGTGERFDWSLLEGRAHERKKEKPFFLAGGLTPENIPEAVRRYGPYGVDLSSAVETDGRKDREKILAAVAAVRSVE